jgi:hypothetical protein
VAPEVLLELIDAGFAGELVGASSDILLTTSGRADGNGGGNGDTETAVTEAPCA